MMCQRIGWPPISTMGLGLTSVSSARRVPRPPERIATFIRPAFKSPYRIRKPDRKGGHLSLRALPYGRASDTLSSHQFHFVVELGGPIQYRSDHARHWAGIIAA